MLVPRAHCQPSGKRARLDLRLQARTSHSKTAGNAPAVTNATRVIQSISVDAKNIQPTDTTTSTPNTARRITPIWQASNTNCDSPTLAAGSAKGINVDSGKVDKISVSGICNAASADNA